MFKFEMEAGVSALDSNNFQRAAAYSAPPFLRGSC